MSQQCPGLRYNLVPLTWQQLSNLALISMRTILVPLTAWDFQDSSIVPRIPPITGAWLICMIREIGPKKKKKQGWRAVVTFSWHFPRWSYLLIKPNFQKQAGQRMKANHQLHNIINSHSHRILLYYYYEYCFLPAFKSGYQTCTQKHICTVMLIFLFGRPRTTKHPVLEK